MHLWLEGLNYSICLLYFCACRQNKKYTPNRSFQYYGFNNKLIQKHMSGVAKNVRYFGSKLGQIANTKQAIDCSLILLGRHCKGLRGSWQYCHGKFQVLSITTVLS